jgi:hygromycin-B 7''-O-kinase
VLKLYPTVSAPASVTEARVLEYLSGRLPVATPELLAHGEYENGWRYVLMSRLPGTELLAALHGLDPGPLRAVRGPPDWPASWPASARRPGSASRR